MKLLKHKPNGRNYRHASLMHNYELYEHRAWEFNQELSLILVLRVNRCLCELCWFGHHQQLLHNNGKCSLPFLKTRTTTILLLMLYFEKKWLFHSRGKQTSNRELGEKASFACTNGCSCNVSPCKPPYQHYQHNNHTF